MLQFNPSQTRLNDGGKSWLSSTVHLRRLMIPKINKCSFNSSTQEIWNWRKYFVSIDICASAFMPPSFSSFLASYSSAHPSIKDGLKEGFVNNLACCKVDGKNLIFNTVRISSPQPASHLDSQHLQHRQQQRNPWRKLSWINCKRTNYHVVHQQSSSRACWIANLRIIH